jgi:hypothetical protein
MKMFMEGYGSEVKGAISGWDRIAFRGTIRWLATAEGLGSYLSVHNILLKDFGRWAQGMTQRIRRACEDVADELGIERKYLRSGAVDKEDWARRIARERRIETGPICLFSVVEPCYAPTVVPNRQTQRLEIEVRERRCTWLYFYWNDPQLGFGHVRLQTWVPFTIQGNLNGRHWLERSLMRAGIDYIKQDNCFRWVADPGRAQKFLDAQLATDWPTLLEGLVDRYFPVLRRLVPETPLRYYWSADETEWATDVMFRNTATLDRLFPMLARYGLLVSDSASIMRYLGKIATAAELPGRISGDIRGDRRRRHEGICVKHRAGGNSVKTYNKAGNVLRVETTINATRQFKVFRRPEDDPARPAGWLPMRKGVADLERRARISQASNERYLNALAAGATETTVLESVQPVCARTTHKNRPVRALNPSSPHDYPLLRFLAQGQWAIHGLRNRDLARWSEPNLDDLAPPDRARLTARVGRLLGLLRAHRLIRKVSRTHRYTVTEKGLQLATLIISTSAVQSKHLLEMAA